MYAKLFLDALENGTADVPPSTPVRFVLPLEVKADASKEENLVRR